MASRDDNDDRSDISGSDEEDGKGGGDSTALMSIFANYYGAQQSTYRCACYVTVWSYGVTGSSQALRTIRVSATSRRRSSSTRLTSTPVDTWR
jgi:hypothetical protein